MLQKVGNFRSSHLEMFSGKGVLKICSKFTGENPCQGVILIKLLWNFIEITLRHECSPVKLLHICRTPFPMNISGWLLLFYFFVAFGVFLLPCPVCLFKPISGLRLVMNPSKHFDFMKFTNKLFTIPYTEIKNRVNDSAG